MANGANNIIGWASQTKDAIERMDAAGAELRKTGGKDETAMKNYEKAVKDYEKLTGNKMPGM